MFRFKVFVLFILFMVSFCNITIADEDNKKPSVIWESKPRLLKEGNGAQFIIKASESINMIHAARNKTGGQDLYFSNSHNEGQTFSKPRPINPKSGAVSSHGENGAQFRKGKGRALYTTWQQERDIYFSRSLSFGRKFSDPIRVNDDKGKASQSFFTMEVGPRGNVYLAWLDGREKGKNSNGKSARGTSSLYFTRSIDRGDSFEKNVKIAASACPCCRPSFAFGDAGEIFVSWRQVFEGDNRVVVVSSSQDGGKTWSEPVKTLDEGWKINGCPHSGPVLNYSKGKLLVVWYTGSGNKARLKMATSMDKGKSFGPITEIQGNVLDANHPFMAMVNGEPWVIFQGRDPSIDDGWGNAKAWFVRVKHQEGQVTTPTALPSNGGSVSYPMLFPGNAGKIYALWTEMTEQGSQVVLCRGRI